MKKKPAAIFLSVLALLLVISNEVHAKRRLPRAASTASNKTNLAKKSIPTVAQKITTSVRFRSDRNAIVVTFGNLSVMQSVKYVLSYKTNGVLQGVTGTITNTKEDPTTRELLFGTCSAGICTYDTNITNAKLTITTTLLNGTKRVKPYKLKI